MTERAARSLLHDILQRVFPALANFTRAAFFKTNRLSPYRFDSTSWRNLTEYNVSAESEKTSGAGRIADGKLPAAHAAAISCGQ